jgi:hypothetical protein
MTATETYAFTGGSEERANLLAVSGIRTRAELDAQKAMSRMPVGVAVQIPEFRYPVQRESSLPVSMGFYCDSCKQWDRGQGCGCPDLARPPG